MNSSVKTKETSGQIKGWRYILLFILICCSAAALAVSLAKMKLEEVDAKGIAAMFQLLEMETNGSGLIQAAVLVLLFFLYHRKLFRPGEKFEKTAFVISFILSAFLICGESLSAFHDLSFIFGRKAQFVIAVVVFTGMWSILYTCLKLFYQLMDKKAEKQGSEAGTAGISSVKLRLILFVVLFLVWALQMIPFLPGSVPHDGRNQLNQIFGYSEMNLHHPFYATVLLGVIYKAGYYFWGPTGGCLAYAAFQSLAAAAVFSAVCVFIRRKTGRILPAVICCLFYAIPPMWWTYMQTLDKDAVYFTVFTWFVLEYIIILSEKKPKAAAYIQMILAAVCCCVFRNDAKYIIGASILVLFFAARGAKWKTAVSAAVIASAFLCLNAIPTKLLGLESDNKVEALSVPLQQIARYVSECGDELTDEEKNIIDRVVEYDGIAERYDPENADPVKNHYKNTSSEEFAAFFKLWLEKLKERPDIYITATMNNMFGYTDPEYFYSGINDFQLYNKKSFTEADQDAVYSEYFFSDGVRNAAGKLVHLWKKTPLLSLLVNPGAYTWLGFIMLGAVIRKKKWRRMLAFCIPILMTAICFVSPVNGLLRYALPIMAISPLYVLLGMLPVWKTGEVTHADT